MKAPSRDGPTPPQRAGLLVAPLVPLVVIAAVALLGVMLVRAVLVAVSAPRIRLEASERASAGSAQACRSTALRPAEQNGAARVHGTTMTKH